MFNNERMADVHFIVGPPGDTHRIPAHKVRLTVQFRIYCHSIHCRNVIKYPCLLFSQYVLAVGSSVFCAMFYGDLAESKSEIHIPDVEPSAFLNLLR